MSVKKLDVFKKEEKTLEQRVAESCCSFHVGLDGVTSSSKPIKFVMSKGGVMRVMQNPIGLFVAKTDDVPGLPDIVEGLSLSIPKIPYKMLLQTIAFFKAVMEKYSNAEAMVQFYYDDVTKEYFIYCPDQEVTGASISFKRNTDLDERYLLVMDIHSHNTMSAYFSSVDDADEKETRIFGVMGKLKNETPEMKFRISVGGAFKEIDVYDIFECPFPETSFPDEWLDKCVKPRTTYSSKYTRTSSGSRTAATNKYGGYDYYSHYSDEYDDFFSPSQSKNTFLDSIYNNLLTLPQTDMVDLVKDILMVDIEAVALAIMEERLEDEIMHYIHKKLSLNDSGLDVL